MSNAIVVLNAGSSSLKCSLYLMDDGELGLVARSQIENLKTSPQFIAKDQHGRVLTKLKLGGAAQPSDYAEAFRYLTGWMREQYGRSLTPVGIGHRVVHGGLEFTAPTLIEAEILTRLERLIPFAPLHQPHNLACIRAVRQVRPDLPQVACFDTAFHQGRSSVTTRFGLPDDLFQSGVRRWGFHGLSYESIVRQFQRIAPDLADRRLIVAHLGSGASLCAIVNGRSVDTTMSFSVLDGLPMGTRCGSLDPGVVLFLLQQRSRQEVEELLYTQSGLLGISGLSSDVRELLDSDSSRATEAIEFFIYRTVREIGSLTAALGGLDALIFTAGVGENSPAIRGRICQALAWLGIQLDPQANEQGRGCLSPPGAAPSVWAIPTDEEGVIAAHTAAITGCVKQSMSLSL